MIHLLAYSLTTLLAASSSGELTVSARVEKQSRGGLYEIVIDVTTADGVSAGEAGIPAPLLQIQVPPSVRLTGKVLETQQELSRNEFLEAPFERLLDELPARIEFEQTAAPAEGEHFALNLIAYVSSGSRESARFVRRRLTLPVVAGAIASEVEPTLSDWGQTETLQIGDKAPKFKLPGKGSKVSLKKYLGKKNILVTTYRAFW